MDKRLLLAILISGFSSTSSAHYEYYYFVSISKTWFQAQSYCRENYTDLATVDNMKEFKQLRERLPPQFGGSFWIGLNKGLQSRWGWSSGEILKYSNWREGEPNGGNQDGLCGAKYMFSGWIDAVCTLKFQFVCYSELHGTFIHISSAETWRNAQTYCRQHYTDLATIHNEKENQKLSDLLDRVEYAWIGLFLDKWTWSDQQHTSFRNWYSGQPWDATGDANCVSVQMAWQGKWDDAACEGNLYFMCYKAPRKRILRLKMTSAGEKDMNDPAMMTAILIQIEQTLRRQGVGNDTTLSWQEKNGKVFHLEKMIMEKKQVCLKPS